MSCFTFPQEIRDLQGRLKSAGDIISGLENKVRQLSSNNGGDVAGMLNSLREKHASDLRRNQKDTEDAFNKTIQASGQPITHIPRLALSPKTVVT